MTNNHCPRCLKQTASVHTCTPTEFVRGLEQKIERLTVEIKRSESWTTGYAPDADMQIKERGPWNARQQSDDHIKGIFIESDDFTHDVRLYVNGDFASMEQKLAYAEEIATRLNALEVNNVGNLIPREDDGKSDCAS